MVDDYGVAVRQAHRFASVEPSDEVDGRSRVMSDLDVRRGAGDQRAVEPLEVLAHQAPRQEVMGLDRLAGRIDLAAVADPPVAPLEHPVVQPDAVARLVVLGVERIQRQLATGVVEQQVVWLRHVVDARAGRPGLDHVHFDLEPDGQALRERS